MKPNYPLRVVLALVGLAIIVLGLNVGLGGIQTLGWQGGVTDFVSVTDPAVFAVRDSHVRFIGGVWLAVGLTLLAGAIWLRPLRTVLVAVAGMVVVGGLVRLAGPLPGDVLASLAFELVGFPLLGWWVWRAERT
jgi:hypothetical protein